MTGPYILIDAYKSLRPRTNAGKQAYKFILDSDYVLCVCHHIPDNRDEKHLWFIVLQHSRTGFISAVQIDTPFAYFVKLTSIYLNFQATIQEYHLDPIAKEAIQ